MDESSEAGEGIGPNDAIMQRVEEIDSKLLGSSNQRLKRIPRPNPLSGPCLQTHVALTDPLSGSQFSWIVV